MRRVAADVFAMITFSTALGMGIEILVSGMSFDQSIHARLMAIPVNLLTGRPYGVFRDWLFRRLNVQPGRPLQKALVDTLAFVLFQIPLYAAVLVASGATPSQILKACAAMSGFFTLSGRPYGVFLDLCRRIVGVPSLVSQDTR